MGLSEPGMRIWLEPNDDPKRKLRYGWRLIDNGNGHFVGIDTSIPNKALKPVLEEGGVVGLEGYDVVRTEVKYGENSRIDFLLTKDGRRECYVEVKSVTTLRTPGHAEFPDCVTTRGAKHLTELSSMVQQGNRAVMVYLVQRNDCQTVGLAEDLDPGYVAAFRAAKGVEVIALGCRMDPTGIEVGEPITFIPPQ